MRRGMMEFANHPALHFSPLGSRFSHLRAHLKPHPRFHLYPLVPPPLALPSSVVFPSSLILFISLLDISFLPPFVFRRHISNVTSVPFHRYAIIPMFFLSLSSPSSSFPSPSPSRALVTSSSSTPPRSAYDLQPLFSFPASYPTFVPSMYTRFHGYFRDHDTPDPRLERAGHTRASHSPVSRSEARPC